MGAYVAIVLAALAAQIIALRLNWPVDTQSASLRKLEIRSGYQLRLDSSGQQPDETILSYEGASEHDHRVSLKLGNARLSSESRSLLSLLKPPQAWGPLTYAPEIRDKTPSGESCQTNFSISFAPARATPERSVLLFPPLPTEYNRLDSWRTIKLQSASELAIRISTNSRHGGPGGQGPGAVVYRRAELVRKPDC